MTELALADDVYQRAYVQWHTCDVFPEHPKAELSDFDLTVDLWCVRGPKPRNLLSSLTMPADQMIGVEFDPGCCNDGYTLCQFLRDAIDYGIGATVRVSHKLFDFEAAIDAQGRSYRKKVERTATVVIYDDRLIFLDNDHDDTEWWFEAQPLDDFVAPAAISHGLPMFLHPVLHRVDGSLSLKWDGVWENGPMLSEYGDIFDEDEVLKFFERGIPWHRTARHGNAIPMSQLRPATELHRALRCTDFVLTIELSHNGKPVASHHGAAGSILESFMLPASFNQHFMNYLTLGIEAGWEESQLTCKIYLTNNQNLGFNIVQIYPSEGGSGALSDPSELPELDSFSFGRGIRQGALFDSDTQVSASWLSGVNSTWLQITPHIMLKKKRGKGLAIGFEIMFDRTGVVPTDFSPLGTEEILDWFDDGIPWHCC